MDTTCVNQEPQKKQKPDSESIENFPKDVLLHILSFLPTEDAVRTSVLCKSWKDLWFSIPNLDFDLSLESRTYTNTGKRTLSMNFVDRAFFRRVSDIKRFTLCCDLLHYADAPRVIEWISTAISRNVQELHIELYPDDEEFSVSLPSRMFTCETLTSLHLNMSSTILKLPTAICFSNLKILTIENVKFPPGDLTSKLFSGLPVLEELKLIDCNWGVLELLSICAPNLHSLSISISEREVRAEDFGNVTIVGDSLKEFYYEGSLLSEYCLSNNSFSLEKAEIRTDSDCQLQPHRLFNLLTKLSNVKLLRLSSDVDGVLKDSAENLVLPMFNNLTDLTFLESTLDLDCTVLLKILQNSPCLKTLNFSGGILLSLNWKEDDGILDPVPPCFLSHLKWIKVCCYSGNEKELFAIKTLLKIAVVLDEIIIIWSRCLAGNSKKQVKVSKRLLELPKGSQNCKIVLE